MSEYRNYKVILINRDSSTPMNLLISADDVNISCPCAEFTEDLKEVTCQHERAWFNFTIGDITVAAIPFQNVMYIMS